LGRTLAEHTWRAVGPERTATSALQRRTLHAADAEWTAKCCTAKWPGTRGQEQDKHDEYGATPPTPWRKRSEGLAPTSTLLPNGKTGGRGERLTAVSRETHVRLHLRQRCTSSERRQRLAHQQIVAAAAACGVQARRACVEHVVQACANAKAGPEALTSSRRQHPHAASGARAFSRVTGRRVMPRLAKAPSHNQDAGQREGLSTRHACGAAAAQLGKGSALHDGVLPLRAAPRLPCTTTHHARGQAGRVRRRTWTPTPLAAQQAPLARRGPSPQPCCPAAVSRAV
jgi:hypothetical protein